MIENVNWPLTFGLLILWGLFLFSAPDLVVRFVTMLISGWQVGTWIAKIAIKS